MPRIISLRSGETVQLFTRRFSSVPVQYRFQARAIGTDALAGKIVIVARQLIFRKPDEARSLQETNIVEAGYWDTFLTVYVTAHTDLEIVCQRTGLESAWWIVAIAVGVVVIAIAIFLSGA